MTKRSHPPERCWTIEYLFHAADCDVQIAVGPLETLFDAERLAAETPALTRVDASFVLHFEDRYFVVEEPVAIVHGDLPSADSGAPDSTPFAFVNAWVFPLRKAVGPTKPPATLRKGALTPAAVAP